VKVPLPSCDQNVSRYVATGFNPLMGSSSGSEET
jgi:hypothetical protein